MSYIRDFTVIYVQSNSVCTDYSSWPSDAIWHHRTWWSLGQVMVGVYYRYLKTGHIMPMRKMTPCFYLGITWSICVSFAHILCVIVNPAWRLVTANCPRHSWTNADLSVGPPGTTLQFESFKNKQTHIQSCQGSDRTFILLFLCTIYVSQVLSDKPTGTGYHIFMNLQGRATKINKIIQIVETVLNTVHIKHHILHLPYSGILI